MIAFLTRLSRVLRSVLKTRARLEAEIFVLRQQLIVLSRNSRARVRLRNTDRLLFVWLYRLYPSILDAIIIVKPETVIRWHRRGFRALSLPKIRSEMTSASGRDSSAPDGRVPVPPSVDCGFVVQVTGAT
jgi:hypothetical protein